MKQSNTSIFSIERAVLRYGLLIAAAFQLYQSILGFLPGVQLKTIFINWGLTFFLIGCFFLTRYDRFVKPIAIVLHLVAIGGFSFFWVNFGGLVGTVPSFFCFYIIFVMIASHGASRWLFLFMTFALLAVFFLFPEMLGMEHYMENNKVRTVQLGVDYFLIAIIIGLFTFFMKERFMHVRARVVKRQQQLSTIAQTLENQNAKLEARHEEINVINENLESIVQLRTLEMKEKHRSLSEYAFINAHMFRGPLCRMIGLLSLMEYEKDITDPAQLRMIKELALRIDHQVQRINEVLS